MDECQAGRGLLVVAVVLLSACTAPSSGIAIPTIRHPDRWSQSELAPGLGIENLLPAWDPSLRPDGKTEVILYLLQSKLPPASGRGRPSAVRPGDPGTGGEGRGLGGDGGGEEGKRSVVVADDVAFRENSKFLTAMERQKWLNSIMRKLVVSQK